MKKSHIRKRSQDALLEKNSAHLAEELYAEEEAEINTGLETDLESETDSLTEESTELELKETVPAFPTASEPSAEELLVLEKELLRSAEDALNAKKISLSTHKDLLSDYMEELSNIPLFNSESEKKAAETLYQLEMDFWVSLLKEPLTYEILRSHSENLEIGIQKNILQCKQWAEKPTSTVPEYMKTLATSLRELDNDKEITEKIIARLRRASFSNKKQNANLSEENLLCIERLRGESIRARNDFVRANLRLVVSVARSFHNVRLPLIDLIQEGNVGLMKAVHRYDHARGFRFSTYAIWWIRQAIERAIINKGSAVRLPVHIIDARRQISRATGKLTQKLGHTPSEAELAQSLQMNQGKISQILAGIHQDPISLDEIISGDDPRKYIDLVRDENSPAIDESLIRENTQKKLRELLSMLSPIEKDIIKRRFGLYDGQDQTLDEIGKQYNLSRERVRQIQTQGLIKMRRMCERRKISTR